jgi:hypothetical protein
MSDWQYRGICIEIAKRGKDIEPNSAPRETSLILPKMFESLYTDDRITRSQVARELTLPLSEVEQLLFGLTMTGTPGGGNHTPMKSTGMSRVK